MRQQRALEKARQVLQDADQEKRKEQIGREVQEFLAGNSALLKQGDFSLNLGTCLFQKLRDGNRRHVSEVLLNLEKLVCDEDDELREKAVDVLTRCSVLAANGNDVALLLSLLSPLTTWISREEKYIRGFGLACSQVHRIAQKLLANKKYWPDTEQLLITLHHIQERGSEKNSSIRGMAGKLLESLPTKQLLENLVDSYLGERADLKHTAETMLTNLGRRSVVYLLNRLIHSENKEERLQLSKLIPDAGQVAVPVLIEFLNKNPPWYVIRNIVFIISELNDASLYTIAHPYLSHPDMRVQQQVLSCAVKISGSKLPGRLIEALPRVHDELKMQIVMQLSQIGGEKAGSALLDLMKSRHALNPETYVELLVKICVALKFSSTREVVPVLNELIDERQKHTGPSDPVIVAARDSLLVLEPLYRHQTQSPGNGEPFAADRRSDSADEKTGSIRKIEQSVKELVAQGDLELAGRKLFANAVTAARDRDFASAELLRNKLLEINPLALTEVIRLGEIIGEEKRSLLSNHHIAVWSELYEQMTTEEFNALFFALKQETYRADETIVRAGETDPSIYFVNAGVIRMTCQSGGRETSLKRLRSGEVIGVAQFFSASVWTFSLTAQTEAQVHVLTHEQYETLAETFPEIMAKLCDFCNRYDPVPELLKITGSDRRKYPRYAATIVINNLLLDPYGNAGKRKFKGELIDISPGGLCFFIQISSRENARLLLGRQIISEITLKNSESLKSFGVIVGVQRHGSKSQVFSVHVRFFREMEQHDIVRIVNLEI